MTKETDTHEAYSSDPMRDSQLNQRVSDVESAASAAALAQHAVAGNVNALANMGKIYLAIGATGFLIIVVCMLLFFFSQNQQSNYVGLFEVVKGAIVQHKEDATGFREELRIGREHDGQMRNVTHNLIRDMTRVLEKHTTAMDRQAEVLQSIQREIESNTKLLKKLMPPEKGG